MSCKIIYNNQNYTIESFKDFLVKNKNLFLQDFISQDIEGFKKFVRDNTQEGTSNKQEINNGQRNTQLSQDFIQNSDELLWVSREGYKHSISNFTTLRNFGQKEIRASKYNPETNYDNRLGVSSIELSDDSAFESRLSSTTLEQIWRDIRENNDLETSIIASAFVAQRFLSEPNTFFGRTIDALNQKKGVSKTIALSFEEDMPTFFTIGTTSYLNVPRIGHVMSTMETFEDTMTLIEDGLNEEVIHIATNALASKEEILRVYEELSLEEKEKMLTLYPGLRNRKGEQQNISLANEYLRVIIQDLYTGRVSEGIKPTTLSLIQRVVEFLKQVLSSNPTRTSQEIINRFDGLLKSSPQFSLQQETQLRTLGLNTEQWFEENIVPVLDKMSQLFPQIKTEVVSEQDLGLLDKAISDKIQEIQAQGKRVNSFYHNGKVYVIKERVNKEIAIEEFLHPFINALEQDNPQLYKSLLLEAKKLFPELKKSVFGDYKNVYKSQFDLDREFLTKALAMQMSKVTANAKQNLNFTSQEDAGTTIDVNIKQKTALEKLDTAVKNIRSSSTYRIDEVVGNYFYQLLTPEIRDVLETQGITKSNFTTEFNSELSKEQYSNWFIKAWNYIQFLLGKQNLNSIVKSIKAESVDKFFTEKGNLSIYGITNNQKSRIPLINQAIYRSITPANYNISRVLKKAGFSLFVGRSYEDFISTIKAWRTSDLENTVLEENKLIPKWATEITKAQYQKREDAWRLSNGLPQLHNTFKYIGRGYLDSNYNLIEDDNGEDIYGFVNPDFKSGDINRALGIDKSNAVMGKYAIKIGKDKIGQYIQYNDRWDLDLTNKIAKTVVDLTQTPFIVTGKIYKATSYDESGNPFMYYTQDANNPDIALFNELNSYLAEADNLDDIDTNEDFTPQIETPISKLSPYETEVKSWLNKFIDYIRGLFDKLLNKKQLKKYDINLSTLDPNMSLTELAVLLSSDKSRVSNLSSGLGITEGNTQIYFNLSPQKARFYLSQPKTERQREVVTAVLDADFEVIHIKDPHSYIKNGEELVSVTTHLENINPYQGQQLPEELLKQYSDFGNLVHGIAEKVNIEGQQAFQTDNREQDLNEFLKEFNLDPYLINEGNQDKNKIRREIAEYLIAYMKVLKSKGSVLISEAALGDTDSKIGGKLDLIEVTIDGSIVLHDFKTIAISQSLLRDAEGDKMKAAQQAWEQRKSKFRKQLSLYRRLLEVNLINKDVNISDSLQIVPIFYVTKIENVILDSGEQSAELLTTYTDAESSLIFGVVPSEDQITGERLLENQDNYAVRYNRKEAQSEKNIPLTKEERTQFKNVSAEQQYKKKAVSEIEKAANSERLRQSLEDIFVLLERTTRQFQNSESELKQKLFEVFQQGEEIETETTKASIELVLKNKDNPDFQKVLINYLNFVQESKVGIDNIYQNFVVAKSYGDQIYQKDSNGNLLKNEEGNNILDTQKVFEIVSELNKIKEFSKSYAQVFEQIVLDLQDVGDDNLFKKMANSVLATTKNIETSFYDVTISLQAQVLSEQITAEFKQKMIAEIGQRIKQKESKLAGLAPNSFIRRSLEAEIEDLRKQMMSWSNTDSFIEKILRGQMGDASFFYSNFIANLSNPDMVLATATGMLKSLFTDLRIFTTEVRENYGREFEKLIAVKGDRRDQVKYMQERLTTKVNHRRLIFDREGKPKIKEWKQLHLLTEVDENVYYEHDLLKDEIEIIKNNKDLTEEEKTAQLKKAKANLKKFEDDNFETYYNEEYQKIMDSIDREFVMSDGKVVNAKEVVEAKFNAIREIHSKYNPKDVKQGNMSNSDLDELQILWRNYNNLFSEIDLNGNEKIGGELEMSKALKAKKDRLRETRRDEVNVKLWAKYRAEVVAEFGEDSPQVQEWDRYNSVRRTTDEYRKVQQEIRDRISEILDKRGGAEQLNAAINEKWQSIFRLLQPYKDNVDKFDLDDVPKSVIAKVTALEKEVYNLQYRFKQELKENPSAQLSTAEKKELSNLYDLLATMDEYTTTDRYTIDYDTALEKFTAEYNFANNTNKTSKQLVGLFEQQSEWYLNNHVSRKKEYSNAFGEKIEITEVIPAYHYRQTLPKSDTVEYQGKSYPSFELVPSIQYTTYSNEALRNPNYYDEFRRRKVRTSSKFYKPEAYRKLEKQGNPEDRAYFEVSRFLRQELIDAQQGLHTSNKIGFAIPSTERSMWDRIMQGEFKESWRNLKRAFVPNEQDITEGYASKQKKVFSDLIGEETKFIPVMYTQDIDIADQSYDVFKSVLQFRFSAQKAKLLQDKKDFYDVLGDTLDAHIPTDPSKQESIIAGLAERLGINAVGKGLVKGQSNIRASTMRSLIDRFFYEEYKKNLVDVEKEAFGKTFRFTDGKFVDSILSFAGWNMMFLNIPNWVVNFMSGNIQAMIEAGTGTHFSKKSLLEGKKETFKVAKSVLEDRYKIHDKSLHSQLIDLFDPVQGDFENEFGEKMSWSMKRNVDTIFFSGKNMGEWELQISMWIAMMKSKKVVQVLPGGEQKVISLWEAYEKGDKGIPKLKEGVQFSRKQMDAFINSLHGVNKALNGNHAKFDQTVAEKYSVMRAAFFMKKFLLPLYINRFGGFRPDLEMGQPREGFYRTAWNTIITDLFFYRQNIWKKYKEGEYTDLQKQGIQKFLREQMFVLGLSLLLLALGYYDDDDEESIAAYSQFLALKVRREIWSTVPVPGLGLSEFISVAETPFIAMNSVKNVGKLANIGLMHVGNAATMGELFEDDLYYNRASGAWDKGDSKFLATLLKVAGIKVNVTDPEALIKGYEFQMMR